MRAACLAIALASGALGQTVIVPRAGSSVPQGTLVTSIDEQGAALSLPDGTHAVWSWDRIASVQGDLAEPFAPFAPSADAVWRAKSRLERHDFAGAEDLFEALFAKYGASAGPTSGVVAWGTLRCRLARGAIPSATPAFLTFVASGAEAPRNDRPPLRDELSDDMVYDPGLALSPLIAPIFQSSPVVHAMASGSWAWHADASRAGELSRLYHAAAAFECGLPFVLQQRPVADDGTLLVYDVVASRVGTPEQRTAARASLAQRLARAPEPWIIAWCRTAVGRSLLRDDDADRRRLGVAELLRVPASLERAHPYLTGVCLAEGAAALALEGDRAGAARLREEIRKRFPGHPALLGDVYQAPPHPSPGSPRGGTTGDSR